MSAYKLVRSGRNFTQFFLFNAELIVFDNAVYPLSMSLLHFKPIFDTPLKKIVRGAPIPGALVRLGHSLARVKIWGRSTN